MLVTKQVSIDVNCLCKKKTTHPPFKNGVKGKVPLLNKQSS